MNAEIIRHLLNCNLTDEEAKSIPLEEIDLTDGIVECESSVYVKVYSLNTAFMSIQGFHLAMSKAWSCSDEKAESPRAIGWEEQIPHMRKEAFRGLGGNTSPRFPPGFGPEKKEVTRPTDMQGQECDNHGRETIMAKSYESPINGDANFGALIPNPSSNGFAQNKVNDINGRNIGNSASNQGKNLRIFMSMNEGEDIPGEVNSTGVLISYSRGAIILENFPKSQDGNFDNAINYMVPTGHHSKEKSIRTNNHGNLKGALKVFDFQDNTGNGTRKQQAITSNKKRHHPYTKNVSSSTQSKKPTLSGTGLGASPSGSSTAQAQHESRRSQ
ncbi:hypothetical protein LIER_38475 [Lithospermum erythrorhizon]|uniref:Uncharacterized protein n=1 Tax=Lithospermum erythrorhizon TaxID=34254 RepID=A0AAV3Q1E8_LITER